MSTIAERIRKFREDKPLPKSQRQPIKKDEFWWLEDDHEHDMKNNQEINDNEQTVVMKSLDQEATVDSIEEEIDMKILPLPEPPYIRENINTSKFIPPSLSSSTATAIDPISSADIPQPVANPHEMNLKSRLSENKTTSSSSEPLVLPDIPNPTISHHAMKSVFGQPEEPSLVLVLPQPPPSSRPTSSTSSYKSSSTAVVGNQMDHIFQGILAKENELTKYLDTHIDSLFDRVDNILEEFGISSSPAMITHPASSATSSASSIPAAYTSAAAMKTSSVVPSQPIEDVTPMNNSISYDVSKSISGISFKSNDDDSVHPPLRLSTDSITIQPKHRHDRIDDPESSSDNIMNHSSKIETRSPFYYLSSSFESNADSHTSFPAYLHDREPAPINEDKSQPVDTVAASKSDHMDDIEVPVALVIADITEDMVTPYLYDDVLRTMWLRLQYLESMHTSR